MIAKFTIDENKWINWILFGICSGLCIMSKVHGVYLWVGLDLYILLYKQAWLRNLKVYTSLVITLVIVSPIILWNIQNDFVTYAFHSKRIIINGYLFNLYNLLKEFVGELVINNPINVGLILIALFATRRYKNPEAISIYKFIGLSLALVILFLSLFRDTRPIWSGPAYVALLPLAAVYLADIKNFSVGRRIVYWGFALLIVSVFTCGWMISWYPGSFGSKRNDDLGKGDIFLDSYGWKEAGKQFAELCDNEMNKGIMPKGSPMVCNTWWGAHQEYHFCRPAGIEMIGLGTVMELHQYVWTNKKRMNKVNFNNAYCVVASDENYNVHQQYGEYYQKVDSIATIKVFRNKKPAHKFYVYRLSGWKNNFAFNGH
jgi:hypothetical protein